MDHDTFSPSGKPASTVALSALPGLFVAALSATGQTPPRQVSLVFETPADALWVDAPECVAALRAWFKAAPHVHLTIITPDMRTLCDVWPRFADVVRWFGHQITALTPTGEASAQLQGIVFTGHSVIYQRTDSPDWHSLPLARNAVAIGMAERLLAWGAGASPQSLGTTGLSA